MITNRQTKKEMLSTVTSPIAKSKLIANSTVEYYDHDGVKYIRFHNTDIIIDDGEITRLYSGGWRTSTTKERLNEFGPINVYQEKGEWFVCDGCHWTKDGLPSYPFYEGIQIANLTSAVILTKDMEVELKARIERVRLNKLIKKYCKVIKDMDTLPIPDRSDCWDCSLFEEGVRDADHLVSHLEEEYVHGSLLWNALKWAGYRPDVYLDHVCGSSWTRDTIVRSVRRYFKAKLGFAS